MAAYIIIRVKITDPEAYREYTKRTPNAIKQYGGKFIVRGGEATTLEGAESAERTAILEFPSIGDAKAFYESPEYAPLKKMRQNASEAQFVAIEGYPEGNWLQDVADCEAFEAENA